MKKLRGRNLAHPGCLIGITTGLINVSLNTLLLFWLGLTLGLGVIGWIIGDRLSSRFPVLEEEVSSTDPPAAP